MGKLHDREIMDYEEDFDDDDLEMDDLAKDVYSSGWEDAYESQEKVSARRKIERRREKQQLRWDLDDWNDTSYSDSDQW